MGSGRAHKSLLPGVFDLRAGPGFVGLGQAHNEAGLTARSTRPAGTGSSTQFGEPVFAAITRNPHQTVCWTRVRGTGSSAPADRSAWVLDPVPRTRVEHATQKHQAKVTWVLDPVPRNRVEHAANGVERASGPVCLGARPSHADPGPARWFS